MKAVCLILLLTMRQEDTRDLDEASIRTCDSYGMNEIKNFKMYLPCKLTLSPSFPQMMSVLFTIR